jgi:predicted aldo/keto reductase-like oxidoreductase
MEYRRLGRTGLEVSEISLGTEYLIDLSYRHVNGVVHDAVDKGVNYFDLFYAQPAFRDIMGQVFHGVRDRVLLTAHFGAAEKKGQYERTRDLQRCEHYFEDYLRRFRTDHVDVLFVHNCDDQKDFDKLFAQGGACERVERHRDGGKARFVGFSGHNAEVALQAVLTGRVDVLMFPVNLTGCAAPLKRELFRACVEHDIGLVAMKPFAGGRLLQRGRSLSVGKWVTGGPSLELQRPKGLTPVQCLSYVLAQPGVSTVVPGCKDRRQLAADLAYYTSSAKARDFASALASFEQYRGGECVYCNHCLPCPSAIDIGQLMRLLDSARDGLTDTVRSAYGSLQAHAGDCIECGACTKRCPFGVDVIPAMQEARKLFGG